MKKIYLLVFLFFITFSLSANNDPRGYVITKNGMHLTGFIGDVLYSNLISQVIFTNDLGTTYTYYPELIRGFVIKQEDQTILYESKYDRNRWMFLKVIEKGNLINLYKAPEEKVQLFFIGESYRTYNYKSEEYWLEVIGKYPVRIHRLNYKKKVRRILRRYMPELAKKIGTKGYRFKNIPEIIHLYNEQFGKNPRFI